MKSVELDRQTREAIDAHATASGLDRSDVVREAVADHLDRLANDDKSTPEATRSPFRLAGTVNELIEWINERLVRGKIQGTDRLVIACTEESQQTQFRLFVAPGKHNKSNMMQYVNPAGHSEPAITGDKALQFFHAQMESTARLAE